MLTVDDVSALALAMSERGDEIKDAKRGLAQIVERERVLREEAIPCAMLELGIDTIGLTNGKKLKVKPEVFASVPKDNKDDAHAFLKKTKNDGMIKNTITVTFGRGEDKQATALFRRLVKEGYAVETAKKVEPQTLKAWLREMMKKGTAVPMDLFGARATWTTKITSR